MIPRFVIPAEAGIQLFQLVLDSGICRSDGFWTFYGIINIQMFQKESPRGMNCNYSKQKKKLNLPVDPAH